MILSAMNTESISSRYTPVNLPVNQPGCHTDFSMPETGSLQPFAHVLSSPIRPQPVWPDNVCHVQEAQQLVLVCHWSAALLPTCLPALGFISWQPSPNLSLKLTPTWDQTACQILTCVYFKLDKESLNPRSTIFKLSCTCESSFLQYIQVCRMHRNRHVTFWPNNSLHNLIQDKHEHLI